MPTNALADEKSPYLRQHAHNPVAWLPWGEAAIARAKAEDKPIFLSIGYSTCHWCHVMAHESFENEAIADVLNTHFIPVKVDREERPDVDRVYMLFVQASTGSGGWPMSVFLTPDLRPFFGGTYYPPDSRYGRPGFLDVLRHLSRAWSDDRARIESSSVEVLDQLRALTGSSTVSSELDGPLFESAFPQFRRSFDTRFGGFGAAPKFPRPAALDYLLRHHAVTGSEEALEMVVHTLKAMAAGGMHDQLGGGFHRYSVDARWFVPHFEKMLYDQAQLATTYLDAYVASGDEELRSIGLRTIDYVLRDMTDPAGGFYSAEDADSPDFLHPGHSREGAFYVWQESEIDQLLPPLGAQLVKLRYGTEPGGNVEEDPHGEFNGQNILFAARSLEEAASRAGLARDQASEELHSAAKLLLEHRNTRPRPSLDNKILTSWNALMVSALTNAYRATGLQSLLHSAERAAQFLLKVMRDHKGQVLRRYCEGESAVPAYLDDYAFLIEALLNLFEATGLSGYLLEAVKMAGEPLSRFEDDEHGGFYGTTADAPDLVLRLKDDYDGAEPSGNSVACDVLLRLGHLTGNESFTVRARRALSSFAPKLKTQPTAAPRLLACVGRLLTDPKQIVVRCATVDGRVQEVLAAQRRQFDPFATVLPLTDASAEALADVAPFLSSLGRNGTITIYNCHNFTCELPVTVD